MQFYGKPLKLSASGDEIISTRGSDLCGPCATTWQRLKVESYHVDDDWIGDLRGNTRTKKSAITWTILTMTNCDIKIGGKSFQNLSSHLVMNFDTVSISKHHSVMGLNPLLFFILPLTKKSISVTKSNLWYSYCRFLPLASRNTSF